MSNHINHAGFSDKTASELRKRNQLVKPGDTIVESDTGRSKTNKDEVEYSRYNDMAYNDAVLFFDTGVDLKAESVPYRKDQALYAKDLNLLFYYDATDSVTVDNGITVLVDSLGRRLKKVGKLVQAQADSAAIDVAGLKADFNSLLAKLRSDGVMNV